MTYEELVKKYANENQLALDEAAHFIDGFFAVIKLNIATGEDVHIYKLGIFSSAAIKTRLSKNSKTNKVEIEADKIYPHFKPSKGLGREVKPGKVKKVQPPKKTVVRKEVQEDGTIVTHKEKVNVSPVLLIDRYFKRIIMFLVLFLVFLSAAFYFGFNYFKNKVLQPYMDKRIEHYLFEKGYTYSAVEEMVNSGYQNVMERSDKHSRETSETLTAEFKKLKEEQDAYFKKVIKMESYLKKKIAGMIKPQLKKRRKRAQVEMRLYTVKKNDTLWSLSRKYLKNPYNWVGLYKTNGKKIKDPDKIYPGQKIFIPKIKEY